MRAAGGERLCDVLSSEHAGQDRVVTAFDARHVHETRSAADQRSTGKSKLRHRLPAAFSDGARAVTYPLAACEGVAHQRMCFEPLEFFERREVRILVVEVDDEADRNKIVAVVIEK